MGMSHQDIWCCVSVSSARGAKDHDMARWQPRNQNQKWCWLIVSEEAHSWGNTRSCLEGAVLKGFPEYEIPWRMSNSWHMLTVCSSVISSPFKPRMKWKRLEYKRPNGAKHWPFLLAGSPFLNKRKNDMESELCFSTVEYAVSADYIPDEIRDEDKRKK